MMRKVDDLPNSGHVGEQAERFFGAKVVKRLHDVVSDERYRAANSNEFVVAGNTKG